MMRTPHHRDQRGFTTIELLVAMTIGLIVSFAALSAFEGFNRGIVSNNRVTDAQDAARRQVSQMVRILREAGAPALKTGAQLSTVVSALPNDVVFRSTSWPGESSTGTAAGTYHTQRICLDTATKTVWFDGIRAGAPGPTTPGSACPSTAADWTHAPLVRNVVNSAVDPLFRIGAAPVRSVGLSLRLEGGTTATSHPLELASGGTLRGALADQVTATDLTIVCNSDGSGRALLTLLNAPGSTFTTSPTSTRAGDGKHLLPVAANASTVTVTITNAAGLRTVLTKAVPC
jgi:prepilin-type N-terminal cleavage/methylation domain-containing protein